LPRHEEGVAYMILNGDVFTTADGGRAPGWGGRLVLASRQRRADRASVRAGTDEPAEEATSQTGAQRVREILHPPSAWHDPWSDRREARLKRWVVALAVIALAACSSEPAQNAATSPSTAPPPNVTTPVTSASSPLSMDAAARQFALDVNAAAPPYTFEYVLLQANDLTEGGRFAPVVVMEFDEAPVTFDSWTLMQGVLLAGDREMLAMAGIQSYATGVRGLRTFLIVRLEEAELVPGPSSPDHFGTAREKLMYAAP